MLLSECLHDVPAPSPKSKTAVDSVSSGARRRNKKESSVSTSSSGGVLLPRDIEELSIVEAQPDATRINDILSLERTWRSGDLFEQYPPTTPWAQAQSLLDLRRLEEDSADEAPTADSLHTSSLAKACGWYIQNGGALLVLAMSLVTALLLIHVGQTGVGPAFTTAGWVLAGGSLLTITIKACISERPKKKKRDGDTALDRLTQEGRRRL